MNNSDFCKFLFLWIPLTLFVWMYVYMYVFVHHPTGPFGVAMSPRSASHRPRHDWSALRDVSPTQGWISDPYLPSSALHGSHCLSRDFTRSEKPCLEKQTSQLSPLMQQWTGSVWVWLLAGPIKSNWPNVRTWSVFQYSVTYEYSLGDHVTCCNE